MCAPAAHAIDVTAGDWKLSFDGNVNADYIYSNCAVARQRQHHWRWPDLRRRRATGSDSSSSVSNGLLPAALSISAATTQAGYDIGVTFGLYPGISTNDGGSPNLGNTSTTRNTALGTAGLDVRQVFLTFGNEDMGTVHGRPQHRLVRGGRDPERHDAARRRRGQRQQCRPDQHVARLDRPRLHLHGLARADQLHHAGPERR